MQYLRVRNWERFQASTKRPREWIKLYTALLHDYEFTKLPDASRQHLIGIWLLAASMGNGKVPNDAEWIARAIKATEPVEISVLLASGFITPVDSKLCNQTDPPSGEERRGEESKANALFAGASSHRPAAHVEPFPTQTGPWTLSASKLSEWQQTFARLDVVGEMAKARQWLLDHPQRQKTKRGMTGFLGNWLRRAEAGAPAPPKQQPKCTRCGTHGDYSRHPDGLCPVCADLAQAQRVERNAQRNGGSASVGDTAARIANETREDGE